MLNNIARSATLAAIVALTGCVTTQTQRLARDEAPVIVGSRVRNNTTPMESAFRCLERKIDTRHRAPLSIAVGDVKDYTGKYSQEEGSTITQGGALMVYSALGKLGDAVQVAERFDTRIAELELAYTDRRQLGDGQEHTLEGGNGTSVVPWIPYFGGTILRSDYYIIGGITELNYNIQSGGAQFAINNSGFQARTFTMNIGVDLRIVDTRTLRVVKTVSLEKQITGYEVGASTFRFFGNRLFDVNIGAKNQEPLQLGVRTTLEQGAMELVGAVTGTDATGCIAQAESNVVQSATSAASASVATADGSSGQETGQPKTRSGVAAGRGATLRPLQIQTPAAARVGGLYQVEFDFGSDALGAAALPVIERIVAEASRGHAVAVQIIASDTESWAPQRRQDITNGRIRAVSDALTERGIQRSRISTLWTPSLSDTGILRDGPGHQIFAKLQVSEP